MGGGRRGRRGEGKKGEVVREWEEGEGGRGSLAFPPKLGPAITENDST